MCLTVQLPILLHNETVLRLVHMQNLGQGCNTSLENNYHKSFSVMPRSQSFSQNTSKGIKIRFHFLKVSGERIKSMGA